MGFTEIFNQVNDLTNFIYKFMVYGGVIFGVLFIYMKKKFKGRRVFKKETDYSNVKKVDITKFLPIDDIERNMSVVNGRYNMAITTEGFDYFTAHKMEKVAVGQSYIGLFNMINNPIQIQTQPTTVDVDYVIKRKKKHIDEAEQKLQEIKREKASLTEQYNTLHDKLVESDVANVSELEVEEQQKRKNEMAFHVEEIKILEQRIEELQKSEAAVSYRLAHAKELKNYTSAISSSEEEPPKNDYYILSHKYDSSTDVAELTHEEILNRCQTELETRANGIISVLRQCNVDASIMDREEQIELNRKHFTPLKAKHYKLRDMIGHNFDEDFYNLYITSDNRFEEMQAEVLTDLASTMTEEVEKGA